MPESYCKLGEYLIVHAVRLLKNKYGTSFIETIPDRWAIPGGRIATTIELSEIANRNGWKLLFRGGRDD